MAAASKPKRGAPRKGEKARTRVLQIRLTEAEFARIQRMGGSVWARDVLLRRFVIVAT